MVVGAGAPAIAVGVTGMPMLPSPVPAPPPAPAVLAPLGGRVPFGSRPPPPPPPSASDEQPSAANRAIADLRCFLVFIRPNSAKGIWVARSPGHRTWRHRCKLLTRAEQGPIGPTTASRRKTARIVAGVRAS